jgi:lysophospholipase L1-like esterase
VIRARVVVPQLALAVTTLLLLVGADRVLGAFRPGLILGELLFPAGSSLTMTSPEFSYTAAINSLGFRDHEFPTSRTSVPRVLVIGDSFVFGWGVDLGQTWVKTVEATLQRPDSPLDVANLGKPGTGPREYAAVAERAIPLLHPDLVVIGLLEGDDLQQSYVNPVFDGIVRPASTVRSRVRERLFSVWPNLMALWRLRHTSVTPAWADSVGHLRSTYTPAEAARYNALAPDIRARYEAGQLNPGLLVLATKDPEYFSAMATPGSEALRKAVPALVEALERIRTVATADGAGVLVLSVPYRAYIGPPQQGNMARLGFTITPQMTDSFVAVEAGREAARRADVPFADVTRDFRAACRSTTCYFDYDDHFTAAGHRTFARLAAPLIAAALRARKGPTP